MGEIEKQYDLNVEQLRQLIDMTRFLIENSLATKEMETTTPPEEDTMRTGPLMVNRETAMPPGGVLNANILSLATDRGPASPQSRPVTSQEGLKARTLEHIKQLTGGGSIDGSARDKDAQCGLCSDFNGFVLNAFRLAIIAYTSVSAVSKAKMDPMVYLNQCCQSRLKYPLRTTNCKCKKAPENVNEVIGSNSQFDYVPGFGTIHSRNADSYVSPQVIRIASGSTDRRNVTSASGGREDRIQSHRVSPTNIGVGLRDERGFLVALQQPKGAATQRFTRADQLRERTAAMGGTTDISGTMEMKLIQQQQDKEQLTNFSNVFLDLKSAYSKEVQELHYLSLQRKEGKT